MTHTAETIRARLADMQDDYIRQLPKKAEELCALWQGIKGQGWNQELANNFRTIIHGLVGTSGAFELFELSNNARALDNLLDDIAFSTTAPSAEESEAIEQLFNALLPTFNIENKQTRTSSRGFELEAAPDNNRILLVDADEEFASFLKASLETHGHEIKVINETRGLTGVVETFKPGLIIMDMVFPESDVEGANAIDALRKNNNQTPVIYLSIHDDMAARLRALRTGARYYLTRPLDINLLLSCVRQIVSDKDDGPYRVLIVDNDAQLARSHAGILESVGMKVEVLTTPLQIIDSVRRFDPELIFMNVYMPECSGHEAAMALRQLADFDTVPIVFLSARHSIDKQLSAVNTGGGDVIVKPVEKNHLIQLATAHIKRSRALTDASHDQQSSMRSLARAKHDAELANKAKSDFIAKMGHELRSPLNSILGFSQLLEMNMDNNLTEQQKGNIDTILNSGWHLLELINEIMDLSKIEAGKVPIVITDTEVRDVVREAISLTEQIAKEKEITINNDVDSSEVTVLVDAVRLRQVIANILTNAVKYNHDNGRIDISIRQDQDDTVELSICDSGIGIPEHAMQELFTPFKRLGAEKSDVEGNGLGLAICQQLIKLMGGDIGAYNNPDTGCTFWLKLPPAAEITDNQQTVVH
jgi:signal transduction histidine kinase